jgi:galactokinase
VTDKVARRRGRHVVTENQRVRDFIVALADGNYAEAGRIMTEGHASLRDNFDVSTPQMDAAVETINATPGVFGTRMTGGGFGGCIVAICQPGALTDGWVVAPSAGARHLS